MNIFDFLTQDEMEDLPEDSHLAFTEFVRHAQRRLSTRFRDLSGANDDESWQLIQDAKHGFMNVVIAAAKRYEIEPFASMEVPRHKDFGDADHREFKADLDHYMTQLLLDNVIRERSNSVALPSKAKQRIRTHVHGLRTCVENADISDAKREALFKKLAEFENELEKKRLSILEVTRITLEIMALPGGVWATADLTWKLMSNVLQTVAEAKVADDEARQLPPSNAPKQLSPPRKALSEPGQSRPAPAFDSGLDDDVPF